MITAADARAWALTHGLRILLVVALILVAREVLRRALPVALRHSLVREAEDDLRAEQIRRAETLSQVMIGTSVIALIVVGGFLVLSEFGVNIVPVVAGLGITGVASPGLTFAEASNPGEHGVA